MNRVRIFRRVHHEDRFGVHERQGWRRVAVEHYEEGFAKADLVEREACDAVQSAMERRSR